MTKDYHRKGRNYELFIKKVFNCRSGKRHGADQNLLIELFQNEHEKVAKRFRSSYYWQFQKVKLYIEKALHKLKKKKTYYHSYKHFSPLLLKLEKAKRPDDLSRIVEKSLTKIIHIENKLKERRKY